jgi:hypothetical protein
MIAFRSKPVRTFWTDEVPAKVCAGFGLRGLVFPAERELSLSVRGMRPKDALECGREAAAFYKPNKEGGSFAAALQGLRQLHPIQS